jgi:hypothetical protein
MANKQRVVFDADPALVEWLKAESLRTGAPVAEICRRAVRLTAFGEAQTKHQPVLFVPKPETR